MSLLSVAEGVEKSQAHNVIHTTSLQRPFPPKGQDEKENNLRRLVNAYPQTFFVTFLKSKKFAFTTGVH
jgi:hypothetical protein